MKLQVEDKLKREFLWIISELESKASRSVWVHCFRFTTRVWSWSTRRSGCAEMRPSTYFWSFYFACIDYIINAIVFLWRFREWGKLNHSWLIVKNKSLSMLFLISNSCIGCLIESQSSFIYFICWLVSWFRLFSFCPKNTGHVKQDFKSFLFRPTISKRTTDVLN